MNYQKNKENKEKNKVKLEEKNISNDDELNHKISQKDKNEANENKKQNNVTKKEKTIINFDDIPIKTNNNILNNNYFEENQ